MQAATPTLQAAQPDDAALRRAWRMYRLDCWPESFEETMLDPVRAQMVRMHAFHLARQAPAPTAPLPVTASRRGPHPAAPMLRPLPPGYVDHKRAAAGDRDD